VDAGNRGEGAGAEGGGARRRRRAILIAGPTASGKSALAIRLARRLGGVVVNADSMQVYRDLRVLTARPSAAEEGLVPHRLYGHVDAAVNWSVGQWLNDVQEVLEATWDDGAMPIVTGGTGLYFKALTEGLSRMPSVGEAVRASARALAEGRPTAALHARLAERDPLTAARLRPTDRQRILRALEVLEASGRPLAAWQDAPRAAPILAPDQWLGVFLAPGRLTLRAGIEARFHAMLAAGALAEVEALAARRLDPALPAMRAHGVPWLLAHLRGEIGIDAAAERAIADTRRYAKRQFTWFRNQLPGFAWVDPVEAEAAVLSGAGPDFGHVPLRKFDARSRREGEEPV
jgi:tRNA dimethylallyltransferase